MCYLSYNLLPHLLQLMMDEEGEWEKTPACDLPLSVKNENQNSEWSPILTQFSKLFSWRVGEKKQKTKKPKHNKNPQQKEVIFVEWRVQKTIILKYCSILDQLTINWHLFTLLQHWMKTSSVIFFRSEVWFLWRILVSGEEFCIWLSETID